MSNNEQKSSLIILTLNEREAIENLWDKIPLKSAEEAIFIDGGSTDGTIEFIRKKGYNVLVQNKSGRGNAFIEGMKKAKYENLIFFSGDGNENPKDIEKIIKYLKEGNDLVIAGRHSLKSSKSDDSDDPLLIRKSLTILSATIADILWNTGVKDPINGLRGIKKSAMMNMKLDAPKHEIELQTTIRAAKLGMKIKEFPTKELPRAGGKRKKTASTISLISRLAIYFIKEMIN